MARPRRLRSAYYGPAVFATLAILLPLRAAAADYEQTLVRWGLRQSAAQLDPSPEGKRITEIRVEMQTVVSHTDPYPYWWNALHWRTREVVVRQELLVHVGDRYSPRLVAESERNIRNLYAIAVARIIPIRSPGGVGLLVVTKDIWSLRINGSFQLVGNILEYLRLIPTEGDFLGLNIQSSVEMLLKLDTLSLGEYLIYPRIGGAPLSLTESGSVIINRQTHQAEGSRGSFDFGKPLFSLEDTWSFDLNTTWDVETVRQFRGAQIWQLPYPGGQPGQTIPYQYHQRQFVGGASGERSFGTLYKNNLTLGVAGYDNRYDLPSSLVDPGARAYFSANVLPQSEAASYLFGEWDAFEARYIVLHDIDTFDLSEDVQLGYSAKLILHWASPAVLSPLSFVEGGLALRYVLYRGDDLLRLSAAGAARWQPDVQLPEIAPPFVNRRASLELENVSPPVAVGRFVVRALLDLKEQDLLHQPLFLGADTGLRGLEPQALTGSRLLLLNLEYRTRSIDLWTLHVGGVLFVDVGSAYTLQPDFATVVGVGIRALFPQFVTWPLRIDFGYALHGPATPWLDRFSSSFGQITDDRPRLDGFSASYGQVSDVRPAFLDQPL